MKQIAKKFEETIKLFLKLEAIKGVYEEIQIKETWSYDEMICHLYWLDFTLLAEIFPYLRGSSFNQFEFELHKKQVQKGRVSIQRLVSSRKELVKQIKKLDSRIWNNMIEINGEVINKETAYPLTVYDLIETYLFFNEECVRELEFKLKK